MRIRKATKKDLKEIGLLMKIKFNEPPFNEKTSISAVLKSLNEDEMKEIIVKAIGDRESALGKMGLAIADREKE